MQRNVEKTEKRDNKKMQKTSEAGKIGRMRRSQMGVPIKTPFLISKFWGQEGARKPPRASI